MNASPTPPEFRWELDEDGGLFIQFANSDRAQSSMIIDDPHALRAIGQLCVERGRGGAHMTSWPADPNATVEITSASTANELIAIVGASGDRAMFIRFTRPDGTAPELVLTNPQSMRNVANVFLQAAGLSAEAGGHGLDGGSSLAFSGEYQSLSFANR